MKNKGFVKVVTILLILASIYQLSFTFKTNAVEKEAMEISIAKYGEDGAQVDSFYKHYLDSMAPMEVFNIWITKFTYQECKENELNLGLDLQGGMNVTLEVSSPEIIKKMAEGSNDKAFDEAFANAVNQFEGQRNFVDILAEEYAKVKPDGSIATVFYSKELKEVLPDEWNSSNEDVYAYLKEELDAAIGRAYEIISTRIDKFGVAQPNIQRLDNGRILVELPGVDDPDRVRKVLQSSAKLEFWNVYPYNEAYEALAKVNEIIYNKTRLDDTTDTEEIVLETAASASDESTPEVAEDGALSLDLDSQTGNDSPVSAEQALVENPVLSKVLLNLTEDQKSWGGGGFLGQILAKDRRTLEKWFALPEVQAALPENLFFKFSFKALDEAGQVYALYALKSNRNGEPALAGDVITDARTTANNRGELAVSMSMNNEGKKEWKRITAAASKAVPKEEIAIVLDDLVYSAPTVQSEIPNGMSEISGNYSQKEADDLVNILKAGKLPAPARIAGESTVGPSLGQDAIDAGQISLVIGFLLVIVFMIFYYGKAGIYADIALLANLVFIIGVLTGLHAALTLPGLAGLVLTIGMAVDANVLVFERVREELRSGKSFKMAIKDGYAGAYSSIIDANLTTLIAGIILWVLGKGPVMGFAVILVIGILSSLFTSIFLTRLFIDNDIHKGKETSFYSKMSERMFTNFNLDFIGKRKMFYIISGLVIAGGIVSLATKGISSGVDFKGGWSFVVNVEGASVSDIRSTLGDSKLNDANNTVKSYGSGDHYMITTSYLIDSDDLNVDSIVMADMVTALSKYDVDKDQDFLSVNRVGPTIAKDTKVRSTAAIIIALIGMFIYIVGRFRKWGFGLGATAALFHDVMIVLSIYSIAWGLLPFSLDIDSAFIAAILTVVGYSINDTVVVFDRVREFIASHKYETKLGEVINSAINQTLSRTLITSFTTLIVILILFIFGGEGLRGFTFALLVGVAVGTYSSVCVATPIVVDFFKFQNRKKN